MLTKYLPLFAVLLVAAEAASPKCKSVADIGFILDSSGSIRFQYPQEKKFLITLARAFGISKDGSHAGVVTFSTGAQLSIKFNQYTKQSSFDAAVNRIPLMAGYTRIDRALMLAWKKLFSPANGARKNVPRILILITDGTQTMMRGAVNPSIIAEKIRRAGIETIVIGIGRGINKKELAKISGGKRWYSADNWALLRSRKFVDKLTMSVCASVHPCDKASKGGCTHKCIKKGEGYNCACNAGFVLAKNGKSCNVIHPCDKAGKGGCAHKCIKKGEGYKCACNAGFVLAKNGKSCNVIHPCDKASKGGCAHKCIKKGEGYKCACNAGFVLAKNGKSCRKAARRVHITLKILHIDSQHPAYGRILLRYPAYGHWYSRYPAYRHWFSRYPSYGMGGRRTMFQLCRNPSYSGRLPMRYNSFNGQVMDSPMEDNLKIVPQNCYATPSDDSADRSRFYLIKNRAPVDGTFIRDESRSDMFSFSVKPLSEVRKQDEEPLRFAHCDATLCDENDASAECQFNDDDVQRSEVSSRKGMLDEGTTRHYTVHATANI